MEYVILINHTHTRTLTFKKGSDYQIYVHIYCNEDKTTNIEVVYSLIPFQKETLWKLSIPLLALDRAVCSQKVNHKFCFIFAAIYMEYFVLSNHIY